MEWERIKDAPDVAFLGYDVLLFNSLWGDTFGEVQIGRWTGERWEFQGEMNIDGEPDIFQPTHWMPIPATPEDDD